MPAVQAAQEPSPEGGPMGPVLQPGTEPEDPTSGGAPRVRVEAMAVVNLGSRRGALETRPGLVWGEP